jgi:hypothetical protein
MLSLADAAQIAQRELEARELAEGHTVVSVIFLKGVDGTHGSHETYGANEGDVSAQAGHYDVRIHPPARLDEGTWLRGFTVALDGAVSPCTTFRTAAETAAGAKSLSTPPKADPSRDWGLGSGPRQG